MNRSSQTSSRPSQFRWVICGLLFFATTINYIDRQILALLKPILDEQFHWNDFEYGMVNSAFQGAYAISLFFFGWFIDRFGTKIGYATSIAAWSLAAIGHALVFSVTGFFAARIALGLGEGGNFPAAIKATAQWFPKKERALATTLFNSGANVGAIIAPALVPLIAIHLGWQWAFIIAGIAGLIWLLAWFPLYHSLAESPYVSETERTHILSDQTTDSESDKPLSWAEVLRIPQTWSFIICKFLTDPVWWFFLIWLPDFFKKNRGLDIKNSWHLLVTIYAIVTVLSIAGGWLTGYLASSGWSVTRARKTSLLIAASMVVPIIFATSVDNWTAVLLIGLAGAAHQAWSANLFSTVSDMFPKNAIASVTGIGGTAGSLGGIGFPMLSGWLLLHYPSSGYAILFGICGFAYLIAFGINHLLAPTYTPIAKAQ